MKLRPSILPARRPVHVRFAMAVLVASVALAVAFTASRPSRRAHVARCGSGWAVCR